MAVGATRTGVWVDGVILQVRPGAFAVLVSEARSE